MFSKAPTHIKDGNDCKPLDILDQVQTDSLRNDLEHYLKQKRKCCDCCCTLSRTFRKIDRSRRMVIVFAALTLICQMLLILFLFPVWSSVWYIIFIEVLQIITLTFYLLSSCKNPGYIEKPKNIDFLNLLQLIDPVQLCPDCEVIRTPRSRHCAICGLCVERFDHHCPWINNCVGLKNHSDFIGFLFSLILTMLTIFGATLGNLIRIHQSDAPIKLLYHIFSKETQSEYALIMVMSIFVMVYVIGLCTPVMALQHVHIKNFCANRTTNERLATHKKFPKDKQKSAPPTRT